MSWIITARGSKKAVSAYVAKCNQYPQHGDQSHIESAKTMIQAEVAAMRDGDLVNVEASGHADESGNRSMKLSIERVFVLPGTVIADEEAVVVVAPI